jgi:hypothetical protein
MEHNPFLANRGSAARGTVEKPQNVAWQTRAAPPTDYENRLGDALVDIFGRGIEALPEIVSELNKAGLPDPSGRPWTAGSFEEQMKKLGR